MVSDDGRISKVVVLLSAVIPCDMEIEKVVAMKPTSLKIGDRFKDKESGKIYILTMIFDSHSILLVGENGKGRRITDEGTLRRTCDRLKEKES